MKKSIYLLLLLGAFGCSTTAPAHQESNLQGAYPQELSKLVGINSQAADMLIRKAGETLHRDVPILVATVVDIDDLDKSSTFGRLVSEHFSSRFTEAKYRVVELKFQNSIYMKKNEGELVLTREIQSIAKSHEAQAVVLGTYSAAGNYVYVNMRVVRPEDNTIAAVVNYSVPIDKNTSPLLWPLSETERKRRGYF